MRGKKWNRAVSAALTVLLAVLTLLPAQGTEVPDLTRQGSISITMKDTETKKAVSGGTLTLYQVAGVQEEDGNYTFQYTEAFSGCTLTLGDLQSATLAEELAAYVEEHSAITGATQTIAQDGTISFTGLSLGLYLLIQPTAADGYETVSPFLVTVPMEEDGVYLYDVDATPKVSADSEDTPDTPKNPTPTKKTTTTLPQTGQLWWPVLPLAAAGLTCFVVGWVRRRGGRDE